MILRLYHRGVPIEVDLDSGSNRVRVGDASWTLEEVVRSPEGGSLRIEGRPIRYLARRSGDRVRVALLGETFEFDLRPPANAAAAGSSTASPETRAPIPGKVLKVEVAEGDEVEPGTPLVVLEAMKMENTLVAEVAGRVARVCVAAGDRVDPGSLLVVVEADTTDPEKPA